MEVDCNSAMTNETLKSDTNGNIRGMKSLRQGNYFRAHSGLRSKAAEGGRKGGQGEEKGGKGRKEEKRRREHSRAQFSRKNLIPKQLVIRRSTDNRFVSLARVCVYTCACVHARSICSCNLDPIPGGDYNVVYYPESSRIFPPTAKTDPARSDAK